MDVTKIVVTTIGFDIEDKHFVNWFSVSESVD